MGTFFTVIENIDIKIVLGKQHVMLNTDIGKLITTKLGHYTIPISPYKTSLNNLTTGISINITLITTQTNQSKYEIALI